MVGCDRLVLLMQTSSVGGLSVTLHTAEAVKPHQPSGPALVMMFTAAANRAMPSRKASRLTGAAASAQPAPFIRRGSARAVARTSRSEFTERLPQGGFGIFGTRQPAALQRRHQ